MDDPSSRMTDYARRLPAALLLFFAVILWACGSDDDTASAPTSTLTPRETPVAAATAGPEASPTPFVAVEPDGERIMADVLALADGIGPRPAGTEEEYEAAVMLAERLRDEGYDVRLQEFPIGSEIGRSSLLSIEAPAQRTIATLPIENSATREVTSRVVVAGIGREDEFPADTEGAIALIQRGELFFNEKVANAEAAGAAGVILYNDEQGVFYGSLSEASPLPVVAISLAEGEMLRDEVAAGEVTALVRVGAVSDATAVNVVAVPPGEACETVTGGHYDSVPMAPGASDNASGTAAVLEIASVMARNGAMGANCFVLFGAEEIGLVGSAHYVESLTPEERERIRAMLNFDMVGVGEEAWWLIGSPELQERMVELADELSIEDVSPNVLTRGLSSDHANFINAGIPALMFHRWEDPLLHTPQDVSDRVEPRLLEEAARMGVALLESLNADG